MKRVSHSILCRKEFGLTIQWNEQVNLDTVCTTMPLAWNHPRNEWLLDFPICVNFTLWLDFGKHHNETRFLFHIVSHRWFKSCWNNKKWLENFSWVFETNHINQGVRIFLIFLILFYKKIGKFSKMAHFSAEKCQLCNSNTYLVAVVGVKRTCDLTTLMVQAGHCKFPGHVLLD